MPKIELNPTTETTAEIITNIEKKSVHINLILLICVITIVLILVTIITCIIIRKYKKKNKKKPEVQTYKAEVNQNVILSPKPDMSKHSGYTLHLWEDEKRQKTNYIYLIDVDNEERKFRSVIRSEVTIGRKGTSIEVLDDPSLSREHCRIIKRGNSYSIEDLNSANGTRYDGQLVTMETPIIPGGVITIGRHHMRIEIVAE